MFTHVKNLFNQIRLVALSLFNTVIAIPYFLVFCFLQAKGGRSPFRAIFWIAVSAIVLILVSWLWQPFETSLIFNLTVSLIILGVIVAIGWAVFRWLHGIWRWIFGIVSVFILFVLVFLSLLILPRPIMERPEWLTSEVGAIEMLLEDVPPEKQTAERKRLESMWDQWHAQYFQTSQGNQIMPYDWFRVLEQRSNIFLLKNTTQYRSRENLTRYRHLANYEDAANPDHLPIGLPKDVDKFTGKAWMSISCASCHVGQFRYDGKLYLINGAPTLQDFQYAGDMVTALSQTRTVPTKFDRFAKAVLGPEHYGAATKKGLAQDVDHYLRDQFPSVLISLKGYYAKEGFGRVDALGRGANGQFSEWDWKNNKRSDGPVSFPPVWYTHDFDWVQSVSAIQQPLGRNMTEAWGVNGKIYTEPYRRFRTTLKPENLFWIETYLSMLEPPEWPSDLFGAIDMKKAKRGKYLYEEATWNPALRHGEDELPKAQLFEGNVDFYEPIDKTASELPQRGLCARCHEPRWAKLTDHSIQLWFAQYPKLWEDDYKFDFRLMSVGTADELVQEGRLLIVVALVGGTDLNIRIFDDGGEVIFDKAVKDLENDEKIKADLADLKKRFSTFPDESDLSKEDKQEIVNSVASIAGLTQGYSQGLKKGGLPNLAALEAKVTGAKELIKEFRDRRFIQLKMYGFDVLGTDRSDAIDFNSRQTGFYQINSGPLKDFFGVQQVGIATALGRVTLEAKKKVYDELELTLQQRADWDGYRPNQFRAPLGYPARPLRGYWATAPFLHNGSVPNLYELLSPVSERQETFYMGSIDFDPEKIGYSTGLGWGYFKFDTRSPGNSNAGHEFRDLDPDTAKVPPGVIGPYLTPEDRMAIIEYMKVLKDVDYDPNPPIEPFANSGDYAEDLRKYKQKKAEYDYRQHDNKRRWKLLEGMRFNPETTLFELKKYGGESKEAGEKSKEYGGESEW